MRAISVIGYLCSILLVCFTAIGQGVAPESQACYGGKGSLDSSKGSAPTFENLKTLIANNDIKSPDELIESFATEERYRDFIRNPVFNRRTRALHREEVSAAFPRIVLQSETMVMQMTGDPRSPAGQMVEIIEYLPKEGRFAFRLINFAARNTPFFFIEEAASLTSTTLDKARAVHESFRNVGSCNSCHGTGRPSLKDVTVDTFNPLPIWGSPPLWPSAFGQVNDRIPAGSQEKTDFQTFLKTITDPKLGSRYRLLPRRRIKETSTGDIEFPDRPNLALTNSLNRMNSHALAKQFSESEPYRALQLSVVAAFMRCSNIEQFLPKDYREGHDARFRRHVAESFGPRMILPLNLIDRKKLEALGARPGLTLNEAAGTATLSPDEFLEVTRLPLIDALEAKMRIWDRQSLGGGDGKVPLLTKEELDSEGVQKSLKQYESQYGVIARLQYLLAGETKSNSHYWSLGTGRLHGTGFRFGNDANGIQDLLQCELGPRFLREYPELNYFRGDRVHPDALTIPREQFCENLRKKSVVELSRRLSSGSPLSGGSTHAR